MNAVVARVGRFEAAASCWCRRAVHLFFLCVAGTGAAQSDQAGEERPRPQMELSTTSLPRFDNLDGATHTSRMDFTLLPAQRSGLGLSLGMNSNSGLSIPLGPPYAGAPTSVDLGLHWRYTPDGNYRIDVTAWRRVAPPDANTLIQTREPTYGARVEMRIGAAPVRNGFVADRGFVGFQLEGGARITLRRSHGKPMVYYRTRF